MEISKEDYLRVMYELYEPDNNEIKSVGVAEKLGVSKSGVSQMITKFKDQGLITKEPYSKIKLTKKGLIEAKQVMYNHRLIEYFLKDVLKCNLKSVHDEAHRLEHAFSKNTIKRLDRFLKNPKESPYGRIIPRK